jgi:hypothetical protein
MPLSGDHPHSIFRPLAPTKVPVAEGRRLLLAGGYEQQDGSNNGRVEFWVGTDGMPITVPYAGPPFNGQHFDAEALEAILGI